MIRSRVGRYPDFVGIECECELGFEDSKKVGRRIHVRTARAT